MRRSTGKGRGLLAAAIAVGLGLAGLGVTRPAEAQDCSTVAPYVFVLLDTSGSMSWAPPCSQAEVNAGLCAWRCDQYDCWVPQMGDSPSSKFYQIKQALYDVVSNTTGVQFGFATFNQDALYARAKHWTYQAAGNGISIPGWGAYPGIGANEVFGYAWSCNTGTGNNQVGCAATTPADLSDVWKRTRIQQLPKLGTNFNTAVTFYVRVGTIVYRISYTPGVGATPGSPVNVTESVAKCLNSTCSSTTTIGTTSVPFNPVNEFLSWDNGASNGLSQTNPELAYFTPVAADASASNTCTGWEPNTDSTADLFNGYGLHQTTTTDPRGAAFNVGDVIPWDWTTDHRNDILLRLAPNLVTNPTASPDFGQSSYLRNSTQGVETFLRLKDEAARPLIVYGSTPVAGAMNNFKNWYFATGSGWAQTAAYQDTDWSCRRRYLIVLTDGDESCSVDPCATATTLLNTYGISTYPIGFGMADALSVGGNRLTCMAANGGTSAPYTPHLRQDLEDTLTSILTAIKAGS